MIIGVSGKAESGKDFCANIMQEYLENNGYKSIILHYGDYLKYICKMYFGWNGEKDEEGRKILQHVGTDLIRAKYPTYWVDSMLRTILILEDIYDYFIIPDTRFPNEILVPIAAEFDIKTVLVTRPNHVNKLTEEQKNHLSETSLDGFSFDYTIIGGEGREGVYQKTIEVLLNIIGGKY